MRSCVLGVLGVSSEVYMKRLGLPGGHSERGYEPLKVDPDGRPIRAHEPGREVDLLRKR